MKMPMPIRSLLRSVVFSLCLVLLGGCSTVRVVERRDGVALRRDGRRRSNSALGDCPSDARDDAVQHTDQADGRHTRVYVRRFVTKRRGGRAMAPEDAC